MTNEELIQTAKEAMRNDTVLNKGIVELLCNALLAVTEQRDAVVAENAAIREQGEEVYAAGYNHGHLNTVDGIAYADNVKDDFYGLALEVMAEVETPATSAAIAALRAEGVEMFGKYIALYNSNSAGHAADFARQLRESKGANHE